MRPLPFCSSLALVLALSACGGAKKDADSPSNADDTGEGGAADPPAPADTPPSAGGHAPGDDSAKKPMPCSGFDITDLAAALSQIACEVPKPDPTSQKDLK